MILHKEERGILGENPPRRLGDLALRHCSSPCDVVDVLPLHLRQVLLADEGIRPVGADDKIGAYLVSPIVDLIPHCHHHRPVVRCCAW